MRHPIKRIVFLVIFVCAVFLATQAKAEPLAVIVNTENPVSNLSLDEIKKIYQDKTVVWSDGEKINAYDLSIISPERALFSKIVIRKTPDKVAMEWANKKITNSAKNQPRVVSKIKLVLYRVKKDKFAIGYVPLSMISGESSIKKVAVIK